MKYSLGRQSHIEVIILLNNTTNKSVYCNARIVLKQE